MCYHPSDEEYSDTESDDSTDTLDAGLVITPEVYDLMHRTSSIAIHVGPERQFKPFSILRDGKIIQRSPLEYVFEKGIVEEADKIIKLRNMYKPLLTDFESQLSDVFKSDSPALLEYMVSPSSTIWLHWLILLQIRRAGVGIPVKEDEEDEEDENAEKVAPKVYQGLDVHGKKRKDLARADPDAPSNWAPQHAPLLWRAARAGAVKVVEWISEGSYVEAYKTFLQEAEADNAVARALKRINNLDQELPSILGAVPNALGEHVVWAALLGEPDKKSILPLLYKFFPEFKQTFTHGKIKTTELTPLTLSCALNSPKSIFDFFFAKGADPLALDHRG